jgi:hypothetical protein
MKNCPNCKKEFDDAQDLCSECNVKLKKKGFSVKSLLLPFLGFSFIVLFVGGILLVAVGVFFLLPFPYTVSEPYTFEESYLDEECEEVSADYDYEWVDWGDGYYSNFNIRFTNHEGQSISPEVTAYFFDSSRYPYSNRDNIDNSYATDNVYVTVYLGPYESKVVNFQSDLPRSQYSVWGRWTTPYILIEECESVTKYRSVPKTREVTKYRDVSGTREVTRYREVSGVRNVTVYATLFEQWFGFDGESDQDLFDSAVDSSDPSLCKGIGEQRLRDRCFAEVAVALSDSSICERIEGDWYRDFCYVGVATEEGDSSLCYKIQSPDWRSDCLQWTGG